jgi:hypothetical protein
MGYQMITSDSWIEPSLGWVVSVCSECNGSCVAIPSTVTAGLVEWGAVGSCSTPSGRHDFDVTHAYRHTGWCTACGLERGYCDCVELLASALS